MEQKRNNHGTKKNKSWSKKEIIMEQKRINYGTKKNKAWNKKE